MWPFTENIRPLMRDILFWAGRGESWSEIQERLTGPGVRHRVEDVEAAMPEARRALYFAEALREAQRGWTIREVWDANAEDIWMRAYGRPPTEEERVWWTSQPQDFVGAMFQVTVEGVEGFRYTPTINMQWDQTLEQVAEEVYHHFLTGFRLPPPPGSVMAAVESGNRVRVKLIGGALVSRIEPTYG